MGRIKNRRDGKLFIRSGDSVPLEKEVLFKNGDFSHTIAKNVIEHMDGQGRLDHIRRGDEVPVEFEFSFRYTDRTLVRTLDEHIFDGVTETITGLTPNDINNDVATAFPFEQDSLQAPGETGFTKIGNGVAPTVDGEFAENVGVLDLEDVISVSAFDVQMPAGDSDLNVSYDAIGASAGPGPAAECDDVKTFEIQYRIFDACDPTGATIIERMTFTNAYILSIEVTRGDDADEVSVTGRAFIKRPAYATS